jgi:hypothetical protein
MNDMHIGLIELKEKEIILDNPRDRLKWYSSVVSERPSEMTRIGANSLARKRFAKR